MEAALTNTPENFHQQLDSKTPALSGNCWDFILRIAIFLKSAAG